ncbi:MAG TPA: response regulator [Candidatus Microsaccharimonas sp.]|nr:response regulator [Candidatus Microsaccharimonas sp.]
MNILIIEPDKLLATTYARALHAVGHRPICCTNAQQAVFAADAQTPDAVLLELQLVSHSGIEFLYEFRSYPEWQNVPIIIVSNVPPAEFVDSWEVLHGELGVTQYLYKPHTTLAKITTIVQNLQPIRVG